ncbi:alpha-crystallin B chain-like [Neocloeon triangulifer]|uniref:alpha-crystallin B chain-like n=1 Tax=Neocloeon triangulifer TaxID=2078957 RepID=UPI00286F0F2D|nr:alpha-crystallin B chain-like [Neocloeon triangulifer]
MSSIENLPPLFEDMMKPSSFFDRDFDLDKILKDDETLRSLIPNHGIKSMRCTNFQQRRFSDKTACDESIIPINDENGFQVSVDMKSFKEEEVSVKTLGNQLIVEGKQEAKQGEKGLLKRHFVRRYVIPDDVDQEKIQCELTEEGHLAITIAKKESEPQVEKVIPIIVSTSRKAPTQDEDLSESAEPQATDLENEDEQ